MIGRPQQKALLPLFLRLTLIVLGLVLIGAGLYLGFIALVFLGGGHASPFAPAGWGDWTFRITVLALPLLLVVLGGACATWRYRSGWRRPGSVVLALLIDLPLIVAASAIAKAERNPAPTAPCDGLPPSACASLGSENAAAEGPPSEQRLAEPRNHGK